ncbi:MAG: xanthine dehydrogenase small subunit [Pseudomonadota bacterium]
MASTDRETVHFLLNGEAVSLTAPPPTLTLLNWLRQDRALTGTKEGCAEGDCGACTVVLASWRNGAVHYRAVNACIVFVATLDAQAVITVEHLSQFGSLHPVQRNLVEQHASQCGFCTPGIVMSLFARVQNGDDNPAVDCLAGNLCRCTGYGPILAANDALDADFARAMFEPQHKHLVDTLPGFNREDDIGYTAEAGAFFASSTPERLAAVLAKHPSATVLAGGTDVGLWVTKQHRALDVVVSTARLRDLGGVNRNAGWLEIGAACSYRDALAALADHHPRLGTLVRRIGSTQIRNTGTVVGNIANGSPIGDMPPALLALGASVVLQSTEGTRELALDDFFIDYGKQAIAPGEFVRAVQVPPLGRDAHFSSHKIAKRFEQDISAVSFAGYVECNAHGVVVDIRLAYGGMAGIPKRAHQTESALLGAPFTEAALHEGALDALTADFSPLGDWRASRVYRERVARNLLIKFAREVATGEVVDLWPAAEFA